MSIFLVETYVVRAEQKEEYLKQLDAFVKFKKDHAQLFEGLISWKLLKQDLGQPAGMYIELWEYENLGDYEESDGRIFADAGMKEISRKFHLLVDPATFTASIWSPVA